MKKLIIGLTIATLAFTSCSKCDNEAPNARVVNDGTESVSVQIQTSGGNTVNINNIAAGTSSDFVSYASGTVMFTISVGKKDYEKTVNMENCYQYDIKIDANNNITSVPTNLND